MLSSSGSHPQFMAKVLHILLEIKKNNRVMNYLRGCMPLQVYIKLTPRPMA